ncbi:neuropeptide Y receptor type 2-like [Saccostrea echinata]|uniref:neuropeptide Y receptor type 2-like n=1 Tax=Saccostrea echinata TaxID=191078 RepID=UPI002A83D08B|nr:neuropeptide Y receptor type 2-like [Saccostrea echinata]XP_061172682.1 neuropeptide Y receptor type 2-like [Saccostrea echinata]
MDSDIETDTDKRDIVVIIRCVLVVIVGVICVFGNLLVIRTLIFFKYPKIPMYVAIGGLAVADMVRAIFGAPYFVIIWTKNGSKILTADWCKAVSYLSDVSMYVAACHLVGLSVIRCILLNDRMHVHSYVKHAVIGSLIIWVVIPLMNIPGIKTSSKSMGVCVEVDTDLETTTERNQWLRLTFSYGLPILVIAVVYFLTYYFSKKFFAESYSRRERRLSRMVTLLILIWAVFKLPYEITRMITFYRSRRLEQLLTNTPPSEVLEYEDEFEKYLNLEKVDKIMECVSLVDLAARPIIYNKFSYYFSRSFSEVINCTNCQNSKPSKRSYRKQRSADSNSTNVTDVVEAPLNVSSMEKFTGSEDEQFNNNVTDMDSKHQEPEASGEDEIIVLPPDDFVEKMLSSKI